jgi:hypothetical protein
MSKTRVAVLASNKSLSDGITKSPDSWNSMNQVNNFIHSIDLPALNTDTGDVYGILTAIPSPWVRAYMMKNALTVEYVTEFAKETGDLPGMDSLYGAMQDEYKGLLTCLALYGSRITTRKIELNYSDDLNYDDMSASSIFKELKNIYEIKGAFGNMLFEQIKLWNNPTKKKEEFNPPYFQLILLDNIVVGATNPQTLAYPAANYNLVNNEIPFYKRGRFRNPINFLDAPSLEKLYHYLKKLKEQMKAFESLLESKDINLLSIQSFMREFMDEIKNHILKNHKNHSIKDTGVLDFFDKFQYPFDILFNMDMKIYKTPDGRYLSSNETGDLEEFNPDLLLLSSESSKMVLLDESEGYNPELSTVLEATDKFDNNKKYHFALPLSPLGINELYDELNDLLISGKGDKYLSAIYNSKSHTLNVKLELVISGSKTPFFKRYNVVNVDEPLNTNVIIWPNFVAKNWREYYLYSELVHNRKGIKALPLYASDDFKSIRMFDDNKVYHTSEDNRKHYQKDFQSDVIVKYSDDKLKERPFNYEIFRSQIPFKGVEIRTSESKLEDTCCGFIMLKSSANNKESIVDYSENRIELESVTIGVDFGSTNTAVTYANKSSEQTNLTLSNRRRFILGRENNDNNRYALANELFFFQNDETTETIKSALLWHDYLRLGNPELDRSEAISGGAPIFERNLQILDGDKTKLDLVVSDNLGNDENAELLYDLKWKREDRYLINKKSYLKAIWLYVNSELFAKGLKPYELLWAFPNSMPKDLRKTYEGIYQEVLNTVAPIKSSGKISLAKMSHSRKSLQAISESEAVCNYALSAGGIGINSKSIFVGVDIGGVTSDLLILANDPGDARALLMKQSSVKIAGSRLSSVIGKSDSLQKCIAHFARKNKLELDSLENINENTSSFLANLLFEEIEHDPKLEQSFYSELWDPENEELNKDHTRGLVAIASYICGLLMFHSGQLVRSSIDKDKKLKSPKLADVHNGFNLNVASFGKGGKLFDWLPTAISKEEAEDFYLDCFKKGFHIDGEKDNMINTFYYSVKSDNLKLEVGMGLTSPRGTISIDKNAEFEILGEEGYMFRDKKTGKKTELSWDSHVDANHIFEFGEDLIYPSSIKNADGSQNTGLKRFNKFLESYLSLVKEWDLFDHANIFHQTPTFAEIRLENYVKSDPDWIAGKKVRMRTGDDSDFRFSCSPFLYQGMCYLDEVIIKSIYGE